MGFLHMGTTGPREQSQDDDAAQQIVCITMRCLVLAFVVDVMIVLATSIIAGIALVISAILQMVD